MKIYAKQVPPEYQESPLFMGDWPENVFVFGNRDLVDHSGRVSDIRRALEELCDAWEDITSGAAAYYDSWIDATNDLLPRDNGATYTRAERFQIVEIINDYCNGSSSDENDALCAALELVTGREWENATIRGCCQGDWQEIIYPAEYGPEWLGQFEIEYFNTGEEWRITENDPDSDDNFYMYTHAWSDDGKRAEIAAAANVDPCDVILYTFDGWSRTAIYTEVTL